MGTKTLRSLVGGIIKSIQRGAVSSIGSTTNVTISAVDMAKSFVTYSRKMTVLSNHDDANATCVLTTTTNLQFQRQGFTNTLNGAWEVIEYE